MRKIVIGTATAAVVALGALVFVGLPALDDDKATDARKDLNAVSKTYDARSQQLVINGADGGFLRAASGGDVFSEAQKRNVGDKIDKTPSAARISPIVVEVPAPFTRAVLSLMNGHTSRNQGPFQGSIVSYDQVLKPLRELRFTDARVTSVELDGLDGAAKEALGARLTIVPGAVERPKVAAGVASSGSKGAKSMLRSNFRVTIPGVDASRVNKVGRVASDVKLSEEGAAEQRFTKSAAGLADVRDFEIEVATSHVATFRSWFDTTVIKGNTDEKSVQIDLLGPDLATVLGSVRLDGCGVLKVADAPAAPNSDSIPRTAVTLYCEGATLT